MIDKELKYAVNKFVEAFEKVFDEDWNYTKEQLGIVEETEEQKQNNAKMGLETIYFIAPDGTFLNPKVDDEIENWGYRGALLEEFRKLKKILSNM